MKNERTANNPIPRNQQVPVAIIGIGCIFPNSRNLQEYWNLLREGDDAITEVPPTYWKTEDYFDPDPKTPDHVYAKHGAFLPEIEFNPLEFGIVPNALEATDTSQLLSLVAAQEALKDAGYSEDREFDRNRVSVILGVTGTLELVIPLGARLGHPIWRRALKEAGIDDSVGEDVIERIRQGYVEWQEASFPGLLGNVVAGRIANRFDFGGTNCSVDAACASSLSALHLAALELADGKADMVLTGGVDTFNHVFMYTCFSKTPALSPSGHARPFDHRADGTTLGEGIGLVVLKRLDDARRDGDKIYAVVKGIGSSSDGKGTAIYAPNSQGQIKAFRSAYERSGVSPETVELMEAHGTGTKVGDANEIESMLAVYQGEQQNDKQKNEAWCALGSVKSQIGHTKSAAGVAGLIKTALALYHKTLPPTIKVEKPALENGQTPFYVNTEKRPWLGMPDHPRRAALSAFGFGGSNFHCVLEEADAQKPVIDWSGRVQILPIAGQTPEDLRTALQQIDPAASWPEIRSKAAQSRQQLKVRYPHRLVLVVEKDKSDLAKMLANAQKMLAAWKDKRAWSTPDGIYYGSGAGRGPLGMIFPGQGAQYLGMLRDLACQFPQFQEILATANAIFHDGAEGPTARKLSDLIYPPPVFSEDARQKNAAVLQSTQVAQPAIGAVSLGLLRVLQYFGVQPEYVAGHSYGELVALCAAGVLDTETFFVLSKRRGQLMGQKTGDKGSMLAVQATVKTVADVLHTEQLDLVIANKNSPQQTVLSGATREIERARDIFKGRNLRCKQLAVAAAFHSKFVSDASGAFLETLKQVELHPPEIPVYADSTAERYPDNVEQIRDILAGQLANPVDFIGIIEGMYAAGVRTFLEVGPSAQISGLVNAILEGKDRDCFAVDASLGQRAGETDLARALAQLTVLGYPVQCALWDQADSVEEHKKTSKKPVMTVRLRGANYVTPRPPKPARPPKGQTQETQGRSSDRKNRQPPSNPGDRDMQTPQLSEGQTRPPQAGSNTVDSRLQPASALSVGIDAHAAPGPHDLATMLQITQENLRALQQFQEQTANLHRQFLEGQDAARQSFDRLLEQQQRLMQGYALNTAGPQSEHGRQTQSLQGQPVPSQFPQPGTAFPDNPASRKDTAESIAPPNAGANEETQVSQPSAVSHDTEHVTTLLLDVVAEKTGYPADMLDLEMGLDADLGIDSIKRVEILSALQQRLPHLPDVGSDKISQIQTLGHIVELLGANGGPAHDVPLTSVSATTSVLPANDKIGLQNILLDVVAEKTGYPADMLDLEMGLDADLGIDSIKRVEILSALQQRLPHLPDVKSEHIGQIQTLGQIVALLGAAPAGVPSQTISPAVNADAPALTATLLEVVAEKTGYPADMLDLQMGLDADLGIDSIKRVEILSALQQRLPHLPEVGSEQMGRIQTLSQIVELLEANAGVSGQKNDTPVQSAQQPETVDPGKLATLLLDVVAEKTGYPADMLDLEMGLDADLGIDSIKRVEILSVLQQRLPHLPEVGSEQMGQIKTLRQIVDFLGNGNGSQSSAENISLQRPERLIEQVEATPLPLTRSVIVPAALPSNRQRTTIALPAGATIWLTDDTTPLTRALENGLQRQGFQTQRIAWQEVSQVSVPDTLHGLLLFAPPSGAMPSNFLQEAFRLVQLAGPGLRNAAKDDDAVLATLSRLDGAFGFGDPGADWNPRSGGLAGLTKTAAQEWPEIHSKAFDLAADHDDIDQAATAILQELFREGPVEVGISKQGVHTLQLQHQPLSTDAVEPPFNSQDVVLITGGARGVTAECAVALAIATHATCILLGRSPAPMPEEAWLAELASEAEIQQAIIQQAPEKLTPNAVRQRVRSILANRDITKTLSRMKATGANVQYYSVDVRDPAAVEALVHDVQQRFGVITGLIHGAGVLADSLIEKKTPEQFARVYDTKVKGLHGLLEILRQNPLKALVLFSSTTARVGRTGQVDYAMANEVLNKVAQQQARLRPACRVVSINWGPWAGGMVTPALEELFAKEGIGLIAYQAGADYLVQELSHPQGPVEVVVLNGQLPVTQKVATDTPETASLLPVVFERTLVLDDYPFLKSHVINGQAVLPAAISMEWLAHGALHSNPGLHFHGFNNFKILKGVVLNGSASHTIRVLAGKARKDGEFYVVPVEMQGFDQGHKEMLHVRAECLLSSRLPQEQPAINQLQTDVYPYKNGDIYRKYLFHGPDFHGIQEVEGCSASGIIAKAKAAPNPSVWIKQPLRNHWLADPLIVDSSFQMLILWSYQQYQAASLPTAVGRYRQFQLKFPPQGGRVVAQVVRSTQNQAIANIEFLDQNGGLVARMENYECVIDPSLNEAFQRNQLAEEERIS